MVTSRIHLDDIVQSGSEELVQHKDNHIKNLVTSDRSKVSPDSRTLEFRARKTPYREKICAWRQVRERETCSDLLYPCTATAA